jgi:hypothetical protein
MVRAGVVSHPLDWSHSGYREIQEPPKRYAVIDLAALCGFRDLRDFQRAHQQWVEQALENGCAPRDDRWSKAIAVASLARPSYPTRLDFATEGSVSRIRLTSFKAFRYFLAGVNSLCRVERNEYGKTLDVGPWRTSQGSHPSFSPLDR